MNFPKIEELNQANCRECSLKNKWPEFYQYLQNNYNKGTLSERLAMFYNNLTDFPVCVVCGGPVKFVNFRTGWRRTCSYKCGSKDPETVRKRQSTTFEHFGVKNPGQAKSVVLKMKKTVLDRYGVENASKSDSIKEKIKAINLEKYGVEYGIQNESIKEKSRQTCLEKYGVEYTGQCKNGVNVFEKYPLLNSILDNGQWLCKCPHNELR